MLTLSTMPLKEYETGTLPAALFAFEDAGITAKTLPPAARKQLLESAKAETFKGGVGECVQVPWNGKRYVLVGLGKRKEYSREIQRRAAAALYHYAKGRFETLAVFPEDWLGVAEGMQLASYKFGQYKKIEPEKLAQARLVVNGAPERNAADKALARAAAETEAIFYVRDLVNRAPSDKTPMSMADEARALEGLEVEVIDEEKAKELGMGSFLGVSRGSSVPPAMVHLAYKPRGAKKKIALVGKGITFDSGGLSLKVPSTHMETMKCDMAGAATVLGVMRMLPKLKLKVEVHGYCAFAYNMPGPDAMKPGDVIKASNGKTIEVLNTDAEGRLVLADALVLAGKDEPNAIIDLATLTGAVVVALGAKVTGAMGNNKGLMRQLMAASERCEEAMCELPLFKDYKDQIKSPIADIQNIGKVRGEAGSIIGGIFLEEFVPEGTPWVHLDIAGTAWNDGPSAYCPVGGTGSVVRTLLDYLGSL